MPSAKPMSTGLGRPRRKNYRKNKRRFNKKVRRGRVAQVAKSVSLSLKDTKKHSNTVNNFTLWTASAPWVVIKPLNTLDMSATNSEIQRESNMIYALNSKLDLTITTNPLTLSPYHLRIIKGWAKGNNSYGTSNTARMPNDQIAEANLAAAIPSHYTEVDSDDFKILFDKTYTLAPIQIYDSVTANAGANQNRALWRDFKFKHNWKFDRKYKFEDGTGASLIGWVPFIAIQIDRSIYGTNFTGAAGDMPSPTVQYNFDTYFKDIN